MRRDLLTLFFLQWSFFLFFSLSEWFKFSNLWRMCENVKMWKFHQVSKISIFKSSKREERRERFSKRSVIFHFFNIFVWYPVHLWYWIWCVSHWDRERENILSKATLKRFAEDKHAKKSQEKEGISVLHLHSCDIMYVLSYNAIDEFEIKHEWREYIVQEKRVVDRVETRTRRCRPLHFWGPLSLSQIESILSVYVRFGVGGWLYRDWL